MEYTFVLDSIDSGAQIALESFSILLAFLRCPFLLHQKAFLEFLISSSLLTALCLKNFGGKRVQRKVESPAFVIF